MSDHDEHRHDDAAAEPTLRCSRCEKAIPVTEAIEAPVGYQCKECAKGAVPARRLTDLAIRPTITYGLLAVIGVVYLLTELDADNVIRNTFALRTTMVGLGEWWVLVTSAFLHANLMHIAFNGILLWRLGEMLETTLGHGRFAALYLAGIGGGSLGVVITSWLFTTPIGAIPGLGDVLTTDPRIPTLGASGAVFALMGAAVAGMRERGVNPWRTDIGGLVLLNLVITFLIPGISVGGHVGGLLAGLAVGRLLFVERAKARRAALLVGLAGLVMLGIAWWLADVTVTRFVTGGLL